MAGSFGVFLLAAACFQPFLSRAGFAARRQVGQLFFFSLF